MHGCGVIDELGISGGLHWWKEFRWEVKLSACELTFKMLSNCDLHQRAGGFSGIWTEHILITVAALWI